VDLQVRTSSDSANYNAIVLTLRNQNWLSLMFDLNYTYGRSLDHEARVQSFVNGYDDSFNIRGSYGPSFADRSHIFNALFSQDPGAGSAQFIDATNVGGFGTIPDQQFVPANRIAGSRWIQRGLRVTF
jgi:hypothetical protein